MTVFVTGATGFVGRELLKRLHAAGHGIRILARDLSSTRVKELISSCSARPYPGSVLDSSGIAAAMTGAEAVIHLVGIISEIGEQTFENVHAKGTHNAVAAAKQAGVRRFIHMSALGTREGASSRYHQTKWAAEQAVRQSGLDYTIFRPSLIFGPQDQFVNLFARMSRFSPILPVFSSPQARFQPVALGAVSTAFTRSLTELRSIGQTYDLCGPDSLTFPEILDQILIATGRNRLKFHVPLALAKVEAALLEWFFPKLLGKAAPLNRDQLVMLQENNVGNPQPANELLGLEQVGFGQGIRTYLGHVTYQSHTL